eukprot:360647-Chlamydomonas_euryale.AAC.2
MPATSPEPCGGPADPADTPERCQCHCTCCALHCTCTCTCVGERSAPNDLVMTAMAEATQSRPST